jgi:hypothetical protein
MILMKNNLIHQDQYLFVHLVYLFGGRIIKFQMYLDIINKYHYGLNIM